MTVLNDIVVRFILHSKQYSFIMAG